MNENLRKFRIAWPGLITATLAAIAIFVSIAIFGLHIQDSKKKSRPELEVHSTGKDLPVTRGAQLSRQSAPAAAGALTQPQPGLRPKSRSTRPTSPAAGSKSQSGSIPASVVLESTEQPAGPPNVINRVQILQTNMKYPLLRSEERISVDPATGEETVIERKVMAADHIIVQLNPDASARDLKELTSRLGGRILSRVGDTEGLFLISLSDEDTDAFEVSVKSYAQNRDILRFAEPDYIVFASQTIPNDPKFTDLWGLNNTGQASGTPDADIDAPEAWSVTTGNNVIVAVIDTGVDYLHEDLAANIWINTAETPNNGIDDDGNGYIDDVYGIDACNSDSDPFDDHGHGTHASGTIAGVGNNGIGVAGVCWSAKVMGLKFLSASGSGYTSDAIECIDYASRMKARVMNNSWGGGGFSQALFDAIQRANQSNALFCAAAGNSAANNDASPHYPSSYTNANVLAVASSTRTETLSSFSSYGATSVDIAAPGSSIMSTLPGNSYASWSGTSMATPHCSGAAALLLSQNISLTVSELKDILMDNTDPVAAFAGKMVSGGRLNVFKALNQVFGITFDKSEYFTDTWAALTLSDTNLAGSASEPVYLSSSAGDSETLTLYPSAPGSYIFTNQVLIAYGSPAPDNGSLEGVHNTDLYAVFSNNISGASITGRASVALSLDISISTPASAVPFSTTNFQVSGLNNGNVLVLMTVSNSATGESLPFSATNSWTAPAVALATNTGINVIYVSGTNIYGHADANSVTVTRYGPDNSTNYVTAAGTHQWPFLSWTTAATNINAALGAAATGNTVIVSNGLYSSELVSVTRQMTLKSANGAASTTIRGSSDRGCVSITSESTVDGFTLTGGNTEYGGGVYMTAGLLKNCTIISNTADYYGGGVYFGDEATVSDCIIAGNSAIYGGGVEFDGAGTVLNSSITDNTAVFDGGGADCWSAGVLSNCLIKGNSSGWYGGGVECFTGGKIYSSTIINNSAGYDGGGVESDYWNSGAEVHNSFISGNTAGRYGGGADCWGGGEFTGCTIINNSAPLGGGLNCYYGGQVVNSIVYYNQSESGANYFTNSTDHSFEYSCTTPSMPGTGNITNEPGISGFSDPHILGSSLCIDAGTNAPAAGTDIDGEARISGSRTDIGCDEYNSGAATGLLVTAISTDASYISTGFEAEFRSIISGVPSHFTWTAASASFTNSPVILLSWPSTGTYEVVLTAYNSDFPSGIAATATVQVTSITQHVSTAGSHTSPFDTWAKAATNIQAAVDAAPFGGTILVSNGTYNTGSYEHDGASSRVGLYKPVHLTSVNGAAFTRIAGSGTMNSSGVKCAYLTAGSVLSGFTLTNGTTELSGAASAEIYGGGVYFKGGGTVSNTVITCCQARYRGGAIYFQNGGTAVNCLVYSNYSGYYAGGAYMENGGRIINSTLANNRGLYYGGGIYCYLQGEIRNSIIYFNTAAYYPNVRSLGSLPVFSFVCTTPVSGLPNSEGCISADPGFADTNAANYHLIAGSPCIDAGTNITGVSRDLDGFTRPLDGDTNGVSVSDIGAYEFLPPNLDTDGDGMPDSWEIANGLDRLVDDSGGDQDADGLTNLQEYQAGSSPVDPDTDDDGFNDLVEVQCGSNPADAASTPAAAISITSPTADPGYSTTNATVDLSGTLSSHAAVTSISISNNRHIAAFSCPVQAGWSFSGMPLYSGRNIIAVRATDAVSNQVSDTLVIDRLSDTGYNNLLYSGAVVQEITFPDNLTPGSTVTVQWKALSYVPLRARMGTGSKTDGWYLFRNAEYTGSSASPWNISGRAAAVYAYQCSYVVPTNQGDFSIWFTHAQMDGSSYMSAVVPDGVDPRPDLVQSKLITRTIVAGGTNANPVSDTAYTDSVNPFESASQSLMRSGGTIIDINIPTNSWSVSNTVACEWTVMSYTPIWSKFFLLDLSNKVIHAQVTGTQTAVRNSSWHIGSTYAKEYTFQGQLAVPNVPGVQQIYFLNMQQGVADTSWMAGNIPAGIDPRPAIYNGMYGRFIERTVVP